MVNAVLKMATVQIINVVVCMIIVALLTGIVNVDVNLNMENVFKNNNNKIL